MNDLIPLNLVIGDRNYRIRIQPADEEVVRKTAKTINDKVVEYKTMFAGKDMQDYIAYGAGLVCYRAKRSHFQCGKFR
jgi:cell division protein ZapA